MRQELIKTLDGLNAANNQTGSHIPSRELFACSVQVVTTSTATGSLKLQFSNDIVDPTVPNGAAPTNWTDITNATVTVSAGATPVGIMKMDLCYQFIRAIWTKNSGAGNVTCIIKAQGQ